MSSATDGPINPQLPSGARAFARLEGRAYPGRRLSDRVSAPPAGELRQAEEKPQVETVTLNKIGDFLEVDFRRLFVWLKSGLFAMLLLGLIGAGLGAAYAVLTPPKYTVATDILIDPSNLQVVRDDLFQAPGQVDSAVMTAASRLRIMTSGNVLSRVVAELKLTEDEEFYDPKPSFSLSEMLGLGGGEAAAKPNPELAALGALRARVSTRADEKSFVATLLVSSQSSDKSIVISEAIVKAFKDELARAEADSAARTASSLNDRLDELKASVKLAEDKVESYKRENGLSSSSGELVSTQTMTQLNSQLLEAQARVISAEATYNEVLAAGGSAISASSQDSAGLVALRSKLGDLRQQLGSQSMVYGPRHPSIARLATEIQAVEAELALEQRRIVGNAKVALDEARSSVAALSAKAEALKAHVFSDNAALVTLRELERDSTSKGAIYEAFLARARQVTEREQIDTTNVRVISTAVPPPARSWPPRTVVVMMGGGIAGVGLGVLLAIGFGIFNDMRRSKAGKAA